MRELKFFLGMALLCPSLALGWPDASGIADGLGKPEHSYSAGFYTGSMSLEYQGTAKKLYTDTLPFVGAYFGAKFGASLGIEFNYWESSKKSFSIEGVEVPIGRGDSDPLDFTIPKDHESKLSISGLSADLVGYYPLTRNLHILGSIGAAKLSFKEKFSGEFRALLPNFGKSSGISWRAGLTLQCKLKDHFRLRLGGHYIGETADAVKSIRSFMFSIGADF